MLTMQHTILNAIRMTDGPTVSTADMVIWLMKQSMTAVICVMMLPVQSTIVLMSMLQ